MDPGPERLQLLGGRMTTYRLGSNPMIYAPGMVRWAINGFAFKEDQNTILNVMRAWPVPDAALHKLLNGTVPYTVEGDAVVFTVEA